MKPKENLAWDLAQLDGLAQAKLLHDRELTPRELVLAAIERIEDVDAQINTVVHCRPDQALEEADGIRVEPNMALAGVPFLLKDGACAQAGVPQTQGNIALKRIQHTPDCDSPLGRRFRQSGLITVGVSNMSEFGLLADTQPLAFGPTRNPWALDRSAGGSSGGAAAAVAGGLVPIAHAADSGGSIRVPAAWCGVVGMKPSRGRMPRPVDTIDDILNCELVITRTVRDTAATLDEVSGAIPGDLYGLPKRAETYLDSLTEPVRRLRVGLLTDGPSDTPVSAECVQAVEQTGLLLQDTGHHVEAAAYPSALLEREPEWVGRIGLHDYGHSIVRGLEKILGRKVERADLEPYSWQRHLESQPVSAVELRAYCAWHLGRAARMLEWWDQGFDLLVTPVTNAPPARLADLAAESPAQTRVTHGRLATYVAPFNVSGQPAIALPIGRTAAEIPVGVQIVAAKGEDLLLLQVAAHLEEAVGWPSRRPNIIAARAE